MNELRLAEDAFVDIPKSDYGRVMDKIKWLWDNRKYISHHQLQYDLTGLYKRVLGKYRIIYSYDSNPDEMAILMVGTRDTIYKDATKKFQ
jgi:mRNA-degrading endonuclease RelE of RelBE toxin-antitoxin system